MTTTTLPTDSDSDSPSPNQRLGYSDLLTTSTTSTNRVALRTGEKAIVVGYTADAGNTTRPWSLTRAVRYTTTAHYPAQTTLTLPMHSSLAMLTVAHPGRESSPECGEATAAERREATAECISDEALVHLKSYKYSAVDKSPVTHYVLQPWCNTFVKVLPLWLAPNMVTLLGFCFVLANVILLEVVMPDLVGPAPSWVYFSFAFGLFMYQTMDNADGKQARRTGMSSGLGELFDHGIDSLNCTLGSLLETAALGLGASRSGALTALIPCLPMFFSTWETYHTHTLYLGFFNGPTEGILIACAMMVVSGIYGPAFWSQRVVDVVDAQHLYGWDEFLGDARPRDLWAVLILVAFLVGHLPGCVINVAKARRAQNLPVLPVFLEWTPIIVYVGSIVAWVGSPNSYILRDNHLVLLCLTLSFVFGRMTTKMILAHLTRQPFPYWTVMLVPLVGGAVLANLPLVGQPAPSARLELAYLRGYFIFAAIVYIRWAFLVVGSICRYLDITALTIPQEKQLALQRQLQQEAAAQAQANANDKKTL
jgi:ethanolaminephosphotransferase